MWLFGWVKNPFSDRVGGLLKIRLCSCGFTLTSSYKDLSGV